MVADARYLRLDATAAPQQTRTRVEHMCSYKCPKPPGRQPHRKARRRRRSIICVVILYICRIDLQWYRHAYQLSLFTITPCHNHSLHVEYIYGVVLENLSFFHDRFGEFVCVGENGALRLLLPLLRSIAGLSVFAHFCLTRWGRDKMAAFSQTTLWNAFSWMKILEFRLKIHWSLFLRVLLTIFQHWFW